MNNSNSTTDETTLIELPPGAFGCTPREPTEEDDNLLKLLISQLDELTRPRQGGKLK